MAIGIAMLGFGASGTLLALVGTIGRDAAERWFARSALLAAAALILSPLFVDFISLDPTQLLWDRSQWLRLAALYLTLAFPFAAVAANVVLTLGLESDRPGRIYGASFVGSGVGAASGVAALWLLSPVSALALPAVFAASGALAASLMGPTRTRRRVGASVAAVVALVALVRPPWQLDITPYKGLPQVEAYPNARRIAERSGPTGWVTAVDASAFRHAPGLSLTFRGEFPQQAALFVDGQLVGAATTWEDDSSALALLDWLPSALPYALGTANHTLVVGAGGGTEVLNALVHGAQHVTAVELNPDVVTLARTLSSDAMNPVTDTRTSWVVVDARTFVARTEERYDLVSVGPAGGFGTGRGGVHSLNEDFLHTVEAYERYLEILTDDGVLAITRWLEVPPRETVRVILTGAEALRRVAPQTVQSGLLVSHSWGTGTVLIKPAGFSENEVARLRDWAVERQLDLDWYPGLAAPSPGFNRLDEPTLYRAAQAAVSERDGASLFAAAYPFDVVPANDGRPYPHHFLRARALQTFAASQQGSWLPFAEWGYLVLVVTLVQAVIVASVLMLGPTIVRTRSALSARLVPLVAYFAVIGIAYLAAELAAIQQLSLLLGHPIYAVAAVLTTFLIFSGLGSVWSDRVAVRHGWRVPGLLVAILGLLSLGGLALVHTIQGSHFVVRAAGATLMMAPLACLMGVPFPIGLRTLAGADTVRIAWAWATNGFASVVTAPLAALIALEAGSQALLLLAAIAYGIATAVLMSRRGPRVSPRSVAS